MERRDLGPYLELLPKLTSLSRLTFTIHAVSDAFLKSIESLPLLCIDALDTSDQETEYMIKKLEQWAFPRGVTVHLK